MEKHNKILRQIGRPALYCLISYNMVIGYCEIDGSVKLSEIYCNAIFRQPILEWQVVRLRCWRWRSRSGSRRRRRRRSRTGMVKKAVPRLRDLLSRVKCDLKGFFAETPKPKELVLQGVSGFVDILTPPLTLDSMVQS